MAPKDGTTEPYQASEAVKALWPDISGNEVNGLGKTSAERPTPVFWRTDGSTAHEPVMYYFYEQGKNSPDLIAARKRRIKEAAAIEVDDIAETMVEKPTAAWTAWVKEMALKAGADDVGICEYRADWAYNDRDVPQGRYAIIMAFRQDYDNMLTAPADAAYIEVMDQYGRAGATAMKLANDIRGQGHFATAKTGPMTEDVLMIPAAIEAGIGELGKHGSMIHRQFGSNFRLSMVLTDLPVELDAPAPFGADEFCSSCQVCTNACPPAAISPEKQLVRGETKWYVDFDKCIPYFVDYKTCGICLVVCPWSRPGVAENLVVKMAKRRGG